MKTSPVSPIPSFTPRLASLALIPIACLFAQPAARAAAIVSEGFNYGPATGPLNGKAGGGEIGLQGAWSNNGNSSTPSAYLAAGLTFSDLPVTGGAAQQSATSPGNGGSFTAAARQINTPAQAGTLYGSYLFQKNADTNPNSVGTLLIGASATDNDNAAKFALSNNEFATDNAGARITGTDSTFAGTALAFNTTYLYAHKIEGLGAASQTVTGWVLSVAQFDAVKAGGITEAELVANSTQTGSITKPGNQTFTGADFFRLFNFTGNASGASATTTFDEIRLSNVNISEGIGLAIVPEPSRALLLLGGLGTVMMRRRRK